MHEATQERTVYPGSGRGAVRPARRCARTLYYLAPGVSVVGGTSEAREGGKLPSFCYMIEASANIGAQESECVLFELC